MKPKLHTGGRGAAAGWGWYATAGLLAAVLGLGGAVWQMGARMPPRVAGGPPTLRLIGQDQYLQVVRVLFGADIKVPVRLAPLPRKQGLVTVGAASAGITPGALEQFEAAARAVAAQVVDERHRSTLVACPALASERDCAQAFFTRYGRLLYRRPLTGEETDRLVALSAAVSARLGSFYAGLGHGLVSMMSSPKFLFIAEAAETTPGQTAQSRLDGFSTASRLSQFLWNGFPDEALLSAAESGALQTRSGLRAQVDRMIASPRLEEGVRHFFTDMLALDKFETLSKDPVIYPSFTPALPAAAAEQTLRTLVDHLLVRREDYRDLFTSRRTFLNQALGTIYRIPVASTEAWSPYQFSAQEHRSGMLTDLGFLSEHAHPGRSSPTRRGRAVRELFLCQTVPNPPPNVNFDIVEDPSRHFRTARERLTAHSTDPACAGCHALTDPIGLALEKFDGAGQYRAAEGGTPIDTTGSLDGTRFDDVLGLGQAMHDHPATSACLIQRLVSAAVGRELGAGDRAWLDHLGNRFAADGYRLPDLLREIALSPGFVAATLPATAAGAMPGE